MSLQQRLRAEHQIENEEQTKRKLSDRAPISVEGNGNYIVIILHNVEPFSLHELLLINNQNSF
jgi:hypothetical protein